MKTSKKNILLRREDLVNNPTPRVPICLCLDTSGSMRSAVGGTDTGRVAYLDGREWHVVTGSVTDSITEMQKGVNLFYDAIRNDETARYAAEIAIVTFDNTAECIEDFAGVDRQEELPELHAKGDTAMGEGVELALDLLEKRKAEYKESGVDYYQPWLVLMTDGEPRGDVEVLKHAIKRTHDAVQDAKLTVFPIGIGEDADMECLNKFSPKRQAINLQSVQFKDFFTWLSKSVAMTSQSAPGESIALDIKELKQLGLMESAEMGWANL